MYYVSLTRLRLRSFIYLPKFLANNEACIRTIKKLEGFVLGIELVDKKLTFWTVTIWDSVEAMKAFRNNDPHQQAMRKLPEWCDEASYARWTQEEAIIPDWDFSCQKLKTEGKVTKVKRPSSNQADMGYGPPVWRLIARPIHPLKA